MMTQIFLSDKNFHLLKQKVILEISYFQNWVDANKLTINYDPKKSCFSIFKPLKQPLPLNYNDDLPVGNVSYWMINLIRNHILLR